ncbi:ABC transporter ATP-binding protein [Actinotalea sp. M2MS4P-6]|uniref:ABC transporter ATP-binding protein n=1 Tax=Actinotalea sp. M2MS4P-6 TaxID=2983762 RepID=UPI0021E45057|nr:ABC transporter ATP-binding protein [Actinotalea sp. M2MS4P-6]MCV2393101.1 ABC transporter ATP-binding protein [Actinotalea sp. M2MS4P-6]
MADITATPAGAPAVAANGGANGSRTMIELIDVTKRFPGQHDPAVGNLNLAVPEGEIVMLIGPSGCGKTTSLKMMNRLIEPTSGRIVIDGKDVTDVDVDELRRTIGYVIQQIGLFPHQTIAANVGTVPRLLGWKKDRITARVDELLALVGLEPKDFRDRYPKELSGGQQQRIGVARGLAADPDVMLMDEPFGAIDPVTRDRLQDEFLALQDQVKKTICFVTHDLTEAVKLGDRIAVFGHGGKLHQFDVPAKVLSEPADDFVEEFVGGGAAVRRLALVTLDDMPLRDVAKAGKGRVSQGDLVAEVDGSGRPRRWHHVPGHEDEKVSMVTIGSDASLHAAVDQMLTDHVPVVAVVDDEGRLSGGLRWEDLVTEHTDQAIQDAVSDAGAAGAERDEQAGTVGGDGS